MMRLAGMEVPRAQCAAAVYQSGFPWHSACPPSVLADAGWSNTVVLEAFVVNVRGAADPDKDGLVQASGRTSCCRCGSACMLSRMAVLTDVFSSMNLPQAQHTLVRVFAHTTRRHQSPAAAAEAVAGGRGGAPGIWHPRCAGCGGGEACSWVAGCGWQLHACTSLSVMAPGSPP